MSAAPAERQGTYIPLLLVLLAIAALIGYRVFRTSQGMATTVGTITARGTPDARDYVMLAYEFKVAGATYTGHTKVYYATLNQAGFIYYLGQQYPVTYAVTDPGVSRIDLAHQL